MCLLKSDAVAFISKDGRSGVPVSGFARTYDEKVIVAVRRLKQGQYFACPIQKSHGLTSQ